MTEASRFLLGEHDWTAFSSALSESEDKVRTVMDCLHRIDLGQAGRDEYIEFQIRANGFLRYMVRSIMGTLLEVGRGEKDADVILTALSGGDRNLAGQTAQACGLTLVKSGLQPNGRPQSENMQIYHVVIPEEWEAAANKGFFEAESLSSEGFIHCSYADQLEGVLERYFTDAGEVFILHLDANRLTSPLVSEPSTNGEPYRISTAPSIEMRS
jgi:uncharacterized protein (DUF952 family)